MAFPVAALLGLVPSAIKLFTGGGTVADDIAAKAVEVGQVITGSNEPDGIMKALQANPEMLLQFQAQLSDHAARMYESETERFKANADLAKTDNQSEDWYVRRMRPTFGYIMAASFGSQMFAVAWCMIVTPQYTAELVNSLALLSTQWSVGMAVLGVYVWKRSHDKELGQQAVNVNEASGVLKGIANAFRRKPAVG